MTNPDVWYYLLVKAQAFYQWAKDLFNDDDWMKPDLVRC
jgi:hypothetical protein